MVLTIQRSFPVPSQARPVRVRAALVQGLPVPVALAAVGVRAEDVSPLRPGLGATV